MKIIYSNELLFFYLRFDEVIILFFLLLFSSSTFERYYFIDIVTNFVTEVFHMQMADVGQSNSLEALERERDSHWNGKLAEFNVPYAM